MVEYLEEIVDQQTGELPISRPLISKYHGIGVTHKIANIGLVIGAASGLLYSQIANVDPLPAVAKCAAYGLAIPYLLFTLGYAIKNQFTDLSAEI